MYVEVFFRLCVCKYQKAHSHHQKQVRDDDDVDEYASTSSNNRRNVRDVGVSFFSHIITRISITTNTQKTPDTSRGSLGKESGGVREAQKTSIGNDGKKD